MHISAMRLSDYLSEQGHGDAEFAVAIGVDRSSVNRMRNGKLVPSPAVMQRIIELTGGRVTANDFFDIPSSSPTHGAPSTDSAEAPSPGNGAGVSAPCSGTALEAAE